MTSIKQAEKIYDLCVQSAKKQKTLTYGEVLQSLGYRKVVSGHAIRYGLELVLIACGDRKLPMLTAIVVNQSTGMPAQGGYAGSSWAKDIKKVFNHKHKKWPDVTTLRTYRVRSTFLSFPSFELLGKLPGGPYGIRLKH